MFAEIAFGTEVPCDFQFPDEGAIDKYTCYLPSMYGYDPVVNIISVTSENEEITVTGAHYPVSRNFEVSIQDNLKFS